MNDILKKIVMNKRKEVLEMYKTQTLKKTISKKAQALMSQKLKGNKMAVIAEVKRRSPSAGAIADIADPVQMAESYKSGGASAVSVLTDTTYFGGSIKDLQDIANAPKLSSTPVLMKDFIIDPIQIAHGVAAGASAILLIVAILGKQTFRMLEEVRRNDRHGIEAIVEVHDAYELAIALDAGAELIGVNNRDLKTFRVDLGIAVTLAKLIPDNVIKIAESGIKTVEDVTRMNDCGYHAVLVGETLVRSSDPAKTIRSFCKSKREVL